MVTIDSLFLLVKHYKTDKDKDCFDKAISLASKELNNVLDESREYPPFIYYLVLEHMDKNPKYMYKKTWKNMNNEEKAIVFRETIEELKRISNN